MGLFIALVKGKESLILRRGVRHTAYTKTIETIILNMVLIVVVKIKKCYNKLD